MTIEKARKSGRPAGKETKVTRNPFVLVPVGLVKLLQFLAAIGRAGGLQ
jgi:hypothetical protein